MNQTPCVSKNGARARNTNRIERDTHKHKSRGPHPTIQPSPTPAIQPEIGNSNSQGSKHNTHGRNENEKIART